MKSIAKIIEKRLFFILLNLFTLIIHISVFSQDRIVFTSNTLSSSAEFGPQVKVLTGNVVLQHQGATMYCDKAYYNSQENSCRAYGNVKVVRPDFTLYGDTLFYTGESGIGKVRGNVRLVRNDFVLTTRYLDFNNSRKSGYFYNGGVGVSNGDTIISRTGYYDSNDLIFKDKVKIINDKYTIFTDTLKHNPASEITYLIGPSRIYGKDTTFMYCENGWYVKKSNIIHVTKKGYIKNKDTKIVADTFTYDKLKGIGIARNHVVVTDSVNKSILKGDIADYNDAKKSMLITKNALYIQLSETDSLFLHADTLHIHNDSIVKNKDTTIRFKIFKAYHKVKLFRKDLQAKCDSLVYNFNDSVMHFYKEPVLWVNENQLTAEFIKIFIANQQLNRLEMTNSAFIISIADSAKYDQIKGKNMTGSFLHNKLNRLDVDQNCEIVYYLKDKGYLLGVNKMDCMRANIFFANSKPDKIWFYDQPKGKIYPLNKLDPDDAVLIGFAWFDYFRPLNKNEVFIWSKKIVEKNKKKDSKKKKKKEKAHN